MKGELAKPGVAGDLASGNSHALCQMTLTVSLDLCRNLLQYF